jgi:two-component system, OmpR family, sensor histidine kinase KdpD
VSHELRTPLTSIVGGVSMLSMSPKIAADPRMSSLVNGILDEAMRLDNDIQSLLDAARISSEGLTAHRDWTDPADLINAAVERTGRRHPDREFKLNFVGNLPMIHVDPVLVEQALGQIMANAAKFSVPPSIIQIDAKLEDRRLIMSVCDEGVGLTVDERSKIAERFFRGQRHLGRVSGSGLGMWIANTFIVANGGKIEAFSSGEDRGTAIRIVFPIAESETGIQGH